MDKIATRFDMDLVSTDFGFEVPPDGESENFLATGD